MLDVLYFGLPGSTRSGEKQRKKSCPTFKPAFSSIGSTTTSVVPGYVVDSKITSVPALKYLAISLHADTIKLMSGSLVLRSGVGTQMFTVSSSSTAEKSLVARNLPASTRGFSVALDTSPTYESPALIRAVLLSLRSMPVTVKPALANSTARGKPTYP